ncbi:MAG: hypothetical protein RSA12_11060, partial [Clostridia bacterium]
MVDRDIGYAPAKLVRLHLDRRRIGHILHKDGKLVAAHARNDVALAESAQKLRRDRLNDLVAISMAARVVEF